MQNNTSKTKRLLSAFLLFAVFSAGMLGCGQGRSGGLDIPPMTGHAENFSAAGPDLSAQADKAKTIDMSEIPRFATNSPFAGDYNNPVPKEAKRLWARSCLWDKAPDLVVEKWLSDEPATEGKYVLVEFWATWCSQCRRAVPLLNGFHEKHKDQLVVVGISDEEEQLVRKFAKSKIKYNVATDSKGRMKKELGVVGLPHIILIEPGGHVVWEGFPLLKGYELTEEVVEKILSVGKKAGPDN